MKTLVVCEKPDAAARVARALDAHGQPSRELENGVPYFQCDTRDGPVIVCSALGHLYSLGVKGKVPRRFYPVWNYEWRPKHEVEKKSARLKNWIAAISRLSKGVDRFVNATDYDIEGALVGYQILKHACNGADAKAQRMKFSTMTGSELKSAYEHLMPHLDFQLAEAGQCRHELDWLYGINLSRVLTESVVKSRAGYVTLTTGRVQGPTLKFVVDREEEIGGHVPIPFWTIEASIKHENRAYSLEYEKDKLTVLRDAERVVGECTKSTLTVTDIDSHETRQSPPFPFDLSTLQSEAYRHYGYSPSRTLASAQRLYVDALISYPRTSSQKLPPDIGYENILRGLSGRTEYSSLAGQLLRNPNLRPTYGPKEDPAHPAIYPTGELPRNGVGYQELRLFDLIARRFMATFADTSVRLSSRMRLETGPHKFFLHGSRVLVPGWTEFYRPYVKDEEQELPNLAKGATVQMSSIKALEKFTEPPPRYNPSSLLRKMEEENLGTKATRADIIEVLYRRNYLKDQRMQPTPLALKVTSLLEKYCPLIVDAAFTSKLEGLMDEIEAGKTSRRTVLVEALDHIRPVMLDLISRESELGGVLAETVTAQRAMDVTFETSCPECGSQLKIVKSRKTGKRFVGHAGPWDGTHKCNFILPLPQFGTLTLLAKRCSVCGFQMVQAKSPGRRPLVSCPRCYAEKMRAGRAVEKRAVEVTSSPA